MKYLLLLFVLIRCANLMAKDLVGLPNHIEGSWGWGECEDNKHIIRYSQNKEFLEFTVDDGSYFYYVAGIEKKGLKVVMLHENRFDSKGNLVYWYVVLKSKNEYYWLRSDREEHDLRGPIKRCKQW